MFLPTALPRVALAVALLALCTIADAKDRASSRAATQAIGASTSAVLQGDAASAVAALQRVPAAEFDSADADYRACMSGRFERKAPPDLAGTHFPGTGLAEPDADPFVHAVLETYRSYWWHALVAPAQRDAQAEQLLRRLRALLGVDAAAAKGLDAIDPLLGRALEARGLHSIRGRTPPLWDLMVWRKQDVREETVALPEGHAQTVRLVLMDRFVSRGWSHYGRCERGGAGGWVTDDAINAVVPAYDLDSDEFRASLLAHESQHFADRMRFPHLAGWELEYRAKLAELWAARETQAKLLEKFALSQSDDLESPHTYANKRVLSDLRQALHLPVDAPPAALIRVGKDRLREAAHTVLVADSTRRSQTH